MTILVIAPHQDDETIGCGGLIARAVSSGHKVIVQHIFKGNSGIAGTPRGAPRTRNDEVAKAARILGFTTLENFNFTDRSYPGQGSIIERLAACFAEYAPGIVLCPHGQDSDKEHELVHACCKEALWLSQTKGYLPKGKYNDQETLLLFYEVWSPISAPAFYLDITAHIEKKKAAIAVFQSQLTGCDWVAGAAGLNAYRGNTLQGYGYCEAFGMHKCNLTRLQHLLAI